MQATLLPRQNSTPNALPPITTPATHHHHHQHEHAPPAAEDEQHVMVSLLVCKQCQDSLLGTFQHCLSKKHHNTTSPQFSLNALTQIDEVHDSKRMTDPPYFNIIKDPTRPKNALYVPAADTIARDRLIVREMKAAHPVKGHLYNQNIQQHKKEIMKLKQQLYDKSRQEEFQLDNVDKLRTSLQKAVKYYAYAEEWQSEESSRLQYDVRCLKAEMSSLMAFLINAEEEKRQVFLEKLLSDPALLACKQGEGSQRNRGG
jgi:hypothetical protein